MKKLLFTFALIGLILAGCSDPVSVNSSPVSNNQTVNKQQFIKIPVANSLSSELTATFTKTIDGSDGGSIAINKLYFGRSGKSVIINGNITFPAGCFKGQETITVTVNTDEASISFSPHMNFQKPAILDFGYFGAELTALDSKDISFIYLNDDGSKEQIDNNGLITSTAYGATVLYVSGAKLKHFSRYGFVKDDEGDGGGGI